MLLWIAMVGGLTLMMGQHARSESLFYYFRLEDQVAENHLLRLVDKHIDFGFVRDRLKDSYSETGRPSIDPKLLLRILLIGYLYGISSERIQWPIQNLRSGERLGFGIRDQYTTIVRTKPSRMVLNHPKKRRPQS